ncbi:DUF4870 domain-containing protein [Dehalogenimonas sp. 4OHTPN]|uniref:DUF4870 domain-containing protein n=1 Tax=Dehalogenimonas sp. 4OHTPN TaxID=3166643 RepID=A0AAU8G7C7_9CHLR
MEKTSTGLQENVAGLLCYLGTWITGIIFLIIEPKNRFVRFHAFQSIVVFGFIQILGLILSGPFALFNLLFAWLIWVAGIILWIVLMGKAYQGQRYKLPVAGDIAESLLGKG